MNKLGLIILPTYNEVQNIDKMLTILVSLYPQLDILVIDDSSPDDTSKIVQEHIDKNPSQIHMIKRRGKLGLGTAYLEGFKWALTRTYKYVFQMDCDFSHSPQDIGMMIDSIKDYDLVIGSRYINGIRIINWPIHRLLLSYFAGLYTRFFTGLKIIDPTSGFKCLSRKALEAIDLHKIKSSGYSFQIEVHFRASIKKLKIKEVPIIFTEREKGKSKMSMKIIIEAVFTVISLRSKKTFGLI